MVVHHSCVVVDDPDHQDQQLPSTKSHINYFIQMGDNSKNNIPFSQCAEQCFFYVSAIQAQAAYNKKSLYL